jgi:lipopolysaccharide transport system permease protein
MPFSQYFRLIDIMARMGLRADANRFFLGYIWWVLEPLLWVAVFYIVFVVILGSRQPDFLVFLMTGKLPFVWFSKSVTQASSSIVGGRGLVGKVNVPKTLFPMATIQECMYRQIAVFALMVGFLLSSGYEITVTWLYLVPLIVVNYLMIVSCSFVGACLVCLARDFTPLINLFMMFLIFVSGIFWDVRELHNPQKTELVLAMNPVAFIIDSYRQITMYNVALDMWHLLSIGAGFGALLCAMVLLMRHRSQYLALRALTA